MWLLKHGLTFDDLGPKRMNALHKSRQFRELSPGHGQLYGDLVKVDNAIFHQKGESDGQDVDDLMDRVHNPRWEYPSWALPKVPLDED